MPIYYFFCTACETGTDELFKVSEKPAGIPCPHCEGSTAEYRPSAPASFKIAFDQNGRKGYKIDMGDRKQLYRSATRENYEHAAGNIPVEKYKKMTPVEKRTINEGSYTKSFKEAMKKAGKPLK